jgi:hypothetical protein
MKNYNPSIFEINTRVWLRRFDKPDYRARLIDVPDCYWQELVNLGFDYVWLMGIWKTVPSAIEKYCFEEGLKKSYVKALKGWTKEDVIGSPYSIDDYEFNPIITDEREIIAFKRNINQLGLKLILDFVPNHFNAETSLLKTNQGIFLQTDKEHFERDPQTFYLPDPNEEKYFAHGRDPFFPAWLDTIQVNLCSKTTRKFLTDTLLKLINYCDGVRCDMAMLVLNNVFKNTWMGIISKEDADEMQSEFWKDAISKVKDIKNDFLFLAEAYWDLEWNLQHLGFDYTYDKRLTDRLKSYWVRDIWDHLRADWSYQMSSIRFLENHDEERAITLFGKERSKAGAVIISTIQGMHLYHDGQFEGKKIKLPVQLARESIENINEEIRSFYIKLLSITSHKVFKEGGWKLLNPIAAWSTNDSYNNILAWSWILNNEKRIVVVNYSSETSACRLEIDIDGYQEEFELKDLLNDQIYLRSAEEVHSLGLYIELKSYHAHIFEY